MDPIKKIYRTFFDLFKYSGHSLLSYDSDSHSISEIENSSACLYYRYYIHALLAFYIVAYHVFQTWRCNSLYDEKIMAVVELNWVMGFGMGTFGHCLNSLLHRNDYLFIFRRIFRFQRSFYAARPAMSERYARSCKLLFIFYLMMWIGSINGQILHYFSGPNFYSYLYSYIRSPREPTTKLYQDPARIILLSFHEIYAMYLVYGHIILADMITHLTCGVVGESLKCMSSAEYDLVSKAKKYTQNQNNSEFEYAAKTYQQLQLITDGISNCFGMMTFFIIFDNLVMTALELYGLMRLLSCMSFESTLLFWANLIYFIIRSPIGWTCMANIRERSRSFQIAWKKRINVAGGGINLRLKRKVLRSLREIRYWVGPHFFAMSNETLLNILCMTTSNIIFFLQI